MVYWKQESQIYSQIQLQIELLFCCETNQLTWFFVKTINENLSGVAADVSDAHHGEDGPVAAVEDSVRQSNNKHSLKIQEKSFKTTKIWEKDTSGSEDRDKR